MAKKSNKANKMAAKNARRAAEAARKANAKPMKMANATTGQKLGIEVPSALASLVIAEDASAGYAATNAAVSFAANEYVAKIVERTSAKAGYKLLLELRERFEAGLRHTYSTLTSTTGGYQAMMGDWETDMTEAGVTQLEQVVSGIIDKAIGELSIASGNTKVSNVNGMTMMTLAV
jgi:hypothetical protein